MRQTTLADLAETFDLFLFDQFGVLLDGSGVYPGAPAALAALAARGKQVVILSNSGKRSAPNEARLVAHGFARDSFSAVISSGEAAHAALAGRIGPEIAPGAAVLVLSRDGDLSAVEGLDLRITEDADAAELLLIAGSRGEEIALRDYASLLDAPARRRVPCLCTNPDMTMLTNRGPAFGAGRIAALYQELGGEVEFVGKPHPLIYQVAAARLGHPDPAAVLCIGDSPAHDIRGGRAAGHSTALVRTGIHADDPLGPLLAGLPDTDLPDYIIPGCTL
ncbi:MAG: TIGR01459 family HAD-type hydrolase [Rhodobacter sp.]|nr:TIGR01459 family HAD-type hydrolase [Rhodobacter sp.]